MEALDRRSRARRADDIDPTQHPAAIFNASVLAVMLQSIHDEQTALRLLMKRLLDIVSGVATS